jgi:cell division protein FtsI (penicillin-binding protein 3)
VLEEKICSEPTLRQLKTCLEGVVTNGTAKSLQSPYYRFAGKTGTALVANGNRGYSDHIYQSSFAGYFPAEQPVYSCIVVIKNKPYAAKYYGAAVAGPVFREIADKLFAMQAQVNPARTVALPAKDSSKFFYSGTAEDVKTVYSQLALPFRDSVNKQRWTDVQSDSDFQPVLKKKILEAGTMPNLKGMGLKDALYLLEARNLKVQVRGLGKVVAQSVEAGKPVTAKQTIVLDLN